MSVKVDWKDADEFWPEEPGIYLTFWSDGAKETYPIEQGDVERGYVTQGNACILFWAENAQSPDGFDS